jgi:hypothetical protein
MPTDRPDATARGDQRHDVFARSRMRSDYSSNNDQHPRHYSHRFTPRIAPHPPMGILPRTVPLRCCPPNTPSILDWVSNAARTGPAPLGLTNGIEFKVHGHGTSVPPRGCHIQWVDLDDNGAYARREQP